MGRLTDKHTPLYLNKMRNCYTIIVHNSQHFIINLATKKAVSIFTASCFFFNMDATRYLKRQKPQRLVLRDKQ